MNARAVAQIARMGQMIGGDIGLIDSPRAASGPTKAVPTLDELWGVSPDPAQDGCMGQIESAFGHDFDQIPQAELVAQVPAYAQDDHLPIEVPPCKQLLKAAQLAPHPSPASRKTTVPDGPCYLHQSHNAFVERFNGTFRCECLDAHWFLDLKEARHLIEAWRRDIMRVVLTDLSVTGRLASSPERSRLAAISLAPKQVED
jgi:Integrase core domain